MAALTKGGQPCTMLTRHCVSIRALTRRSNARDRMKMPVAHFFTSDGWASRGYTSSASMPMLRRCGRTSLRAASQPIQHHRRVPHHLPANTAPINRAFPVARVAAGSGQVGEGLGLPVRYLRHLKTGIGSRTKELQPSLLPKQIYRSCVFRSSIGLAPALSNRIHRKEPSNFSRQIERDASVSISRRQQAIGNHRISM